MKLRHEYAGDQAIMTTKAAQNRAGLTAGSVTRVTARPATGLTPARETKRPYKPRSRKCACGCGRIVERTPQTPHKRYFDDACRQRAYRRRTAKTRPAAAGSGAVLELATCEFCGATFLATAGKGAKYCKPSHRTAAAEQRRAAAIEAAIAIVGSIGGLTPEDVVAFVEREGMKKISRYLRQQGYVYSEAARAWLMAVPVDSVFVNARE